MSFGNISLEVLSLHAVLKECEETLFDRPLQPTRAERLIVIKDGCDKVLVDLQSLVDKYESLGTQSKRTWDRMKWGNEDIGEIRGRLISNTTMLNAFISTSQSNVESKLDNFIAEYRQGRREASIISLQTVDSLSGDDKALWRTIRKELEDIGITVAAFDANRTFIFDWFIRAAETGAFEEQGESGIDDQSDYSEEQASPGTNEHVNQDAGQATRHTQSAAFTNIREERPSAQPQSLVAATVAEPESPRGPRLSRDIVASNRALKSTQVSRIGAFLARLSPPGPRLLRAIDTEDFHKALKILSDEASLKHLDPETLGKALLITTTLEGLGSSDHLSLISKLIARGANVDYRSSDSFARTPLQNSVDKKSIAAVRLLLENGADVNYKSPEPAKARSLQKECFAPRLALTEDTEMLRFLLSAGADDSALYKMPLADSSIELFFVRVALLHEAARLGAIPALEVLIEHGAEIDFISPSYGTALMVALLKGTENTAKILLARGANPNININPKYMIDLEKWYTRRCKRFFERLYETPIEAAIVGGKLSMVKLLLKSGVLPSQSTLNFANDVRYSNRQYVDQIRDLTYDQCVAYDLIFDGHCTWESVGNWSREDDEIVKVLEETVLHQND